MLKKISLISIALMIAVTLAGCGGAPDNGTGKPADNAAKTDKVEQKVTSGEEAVCKYFPKELIEEAIGRPIVKVEDSSIAEDYICIYYTEYSETYDHTPYGDKPGGPQIVVVLEDESLVTSKADLEKYGYIFSKDEGYAVDNRLVSSGKDVYRADLIINENRFFRISSNHFAVNADEIIKIGKRFAERMKNGN